MSDSNFRCLAIESSAGTGSLAVSDGQNLFTDTWSGAAQESRHLYQRVSALLSSAGLALRDLDAIAFGCGPGTFTGLRVTAAAAQSLAFGAALPVVRVSSLAALAAGAWRRHQKAPIAACLDARMGEAYLGLYDIDAQESLVARLADALIQPESFRLPEVTGIVAAGNGWSACPQLLDNHAARIAVQDFARVPAAKDVLVLAASMFKAGQVTTAEHALPNYLRDQVTG